MHGASSTIIIVLQGISVGVLSNGLLGELRIIFSSVPQVIT